MALPVVVVQNQTASPIALPGLAVTVPASGQTTLSDFNFAYEIFSDPTLEAQVSAGNLVLEIDSVELSSDQAGAVLGLVTEGSILSPFSAYDSTGGQTFTTTATTINLDAQSVVADSGTYTLAADEVTVVRSGTYLVSAQVGLDSSGGGRTQAASWVEAGGVEVPGTRMTHYLRQTPFGATGAVSGVRQIPGGTVLRLRSQRLTGTGTCRMLQNGSRITLVRIS